MAMEHLDRSARVVGIPEFQATPSWLSDWSQLPEEIIKEQISQYLAVPRHASSLRLVCRRWRVGLLPFIFVNHENIQRMKERHYSNIWRCEYLAAADFETLSNLIRDDASIQKLVFEANGVTAEMVSVLCEGLRLNTTLRELVLSFNPIGDQGVASLARALKHNNSITAIDLLNVGLADTSELAEMIKTGCRNLRRLNLGANAIFDDGASEICSSIAFHPHLEKIIFSSTNAGDGAAKAIAGAIRSSICRLRSIDFSYCSIGKSGVLAIAAALKDNSTVEELLLNWNDVLGDDALPLAEALRVNKTLRKLGLRGNVLTDDEVLAFDSVLLESNSTLVEVDVRQNMPAEQEAPLIASLRCPSRFIWDSAESH